MDLLDTTPPLFGHVKLNTMVVPKGNHGPSKAGVILPDHNCNRIVSWFCIKYRLPQIANFGLLIREGLSLAWVLDFPNVILTPPYYVDLVLYARYHPLKRGRYLYSDRDLIQ